AAQLYITRLFFSSRTTLLQASFISILTCLSETIFLYIYQRVYEKAKEAISHCSVFIGFLSHLRCERKPIWAKTPAVCFWKGLSSQSNSYIPLSSRSLFVHPLRRCHIGLVYIS